MSDTTASPLGAKKSFDSYIPSLCQRLAAGKGLFSSFSVYSHVVEVFVDAPQFDLVNELGALQFHREFPSAELEEAAAHQFVEQPVFLVGKRQLYRSVELSLEKHVSLQTFGDVGQLKVDLLGLSIVGQAQVLAAGDELAVSLGNRYASGIALSGFDMEQLAEVDELKGDRLAVLPLGFFGGLSLSVSVPVP